MSRIHNHYFKPVPPQSTDVDVYRVLLMFAVADPCLQHAIKKLLVAGGRGAGKDIQQDIQEAIDSLNRWQEMREEEQPAILTAEQAASIFEGQPGTFELQSARHRIYDLLMDKDAAQAYKEAEAFLQRTSPDLYKLLQTHRAQSALQPSDMVAFVPSHHPI